MNNSGKNKEQIVFFGTGPVASKSLELLLAHQEIEAVVTKPKPIGHRGDYPVLAIAKQHNLEIIEVNSKQEVTTKLKGSNLQSKLGVLIDFGIIVSQDAIDFFPLGIVNSHFSRLPEWRGADPISFSILSGQKTTAVSLMLIDQGMDTGKLLAQSGLNILPGDTTPSLTEKLINLSDKLLAENLIKYASESIKPRSQPHEDRATYSRKLTKEDGQVDWSKSAEVIEREIRAFIDWPKSYTELAGKNVVITSSNVSNFSGKPGDVVVNNNELHICCGTKSLQILKLKPAGKNEMTAEGFLAGHRRHLNT